MRRDVPVSVPLMAIPMLSGVSGWLLLARYGEGSAQGSTITVLHVTSRGPLAFGVARIAMVFAFRRRCFALA